MHTADTPPHWPLDTWAELTIPHQSGTYRLYLRVPTAADTDKAFALGGKNQKAVFKELVRLTGNGGDEAILLRPELLSKAARGFEKLYHAALTAAHKAPAP